MGEDEEARKEAVRRVNGEADPGLFDWYWMPGQKPRIPRRRRRAAGLVIREECYGCPIANLTNCGTCRDEETGWLEGRHGKTWFCRFFKWVAWRWRRMRYK